MNRYEPSTPRTAFGVVACALTVVTFALAVVGPATMIAQSDAAPVVAQRTVAPVGTQG
jgi:hypothetical protein